MTLGESKQMPKWNISPELEASLRSKDVLTARDEMILRAVDSKVDDLNIPMQEVPIAIKKQEDDLLLLYPDGPQHESRSSTIIQSNYDRTFWANLLIACDGPDMELHSDSSSQLTKRSQAKLTNTKNDLEAFVQYYTPMRIGDPTVVGVPGVPVKTPGYFDITKRLENPTTSQIAQAAEEIRDWISINTDDPEFVSVQINFMFAGHGYGDVSGESGIVVRDGTLSSIKLGEFLLQTLPDTDGDASPSRLDIFLDCCHSGAIVRDITGTISSEQEDFPDKYGKKSKLGYGNIFCSCLEDEESQEDDALQHGLFTFTFLNEFSRRQPEKASEYNLALRDVGWFTNSKQHPFAVFFRGEYSPSSFPAVTYYGSKLFPEIELESLVTTTISRALQEIANETPVRNNEVVLNPVAIAVRAMRYFREKYLEKEREIAKAPSTRAIFTRDEFKDREAYWH